MRGRSALFAELCLAGTAFGKFGSRGLCLLAESRDRVSGPSKGTLVAAIRAAKSTFNDTKTNMISVISAGETL